MPPPLWTRTRRSECLAQRDHAPRVPNQEENQRGLLSPRVRRGTACNSTDALRGGSIGLAF